MNARYSFLALLGALALVAYGCDEPAATVTGAFGGPIDFAYACEGVGATQAPANDERALTLAYTSMCEDIEVSTGSGGAEFVQGHLIGVVLNDAPPGVNLIQMNPASPGGRKVLDTDPFLPGFTPVEVPPNPIRVLRASDWSAFYVISVGEPAVTRLVIQGVQGADGLRYTTARFDLPGVASDAVIAGDRLLVAGAWQPELWVFDLAVDPADPPMVTVPMPALVGSLAVLDDDELLATWLERPVVSRLAAADGTVLVEAGIRPACSDTLDNDGDGLADAADPDCDSDLDVTESGGLVARPADLPALSGYYDANALPCADGVDNDDDGLTDAADPACETSALGEALPECGDGLDNDFDGLVDTDDESCYGAYDLSEGLGGAWGPYAATVVDAGDHGRFVYALDPQRGRLAVFDASADGLERVAVPWSAATAEPEVYRGYLDAEGVQKEDDELRAQRVAARPGPALQGELDLRLPATPGLWLSAGQLRGELWGRLIEPQSGDSVASLPNGLSRVAGIDWVPLGCDPDFEDRCYQPALDDQTWYVFMPRADGSVQLVEAVRRGAPLHRFAQTTTDPARRGTDVSKPGLALRGTSRALGSNLREGFPFMGPLADELIYDASEAATLAAAAIAEAATEAGDDEAAAEALAHIEVLEPDRFRRFGVWPPEDLLCDAGTCRGAVGGLGAPCAAHEECAAELHCAGGLCAPDKPVEGDAVGDLGCDDDAMCAGGWFCDGDACAEAGAEGDDCVRDAACVAELHCAGGSCAPDADLGGGCDRHAACGLGGWCDRVAGVCRPGCVEDLDCARDLEAAPSERWFLTWEGALPGTRSALGRLVEQETVEVPVAGDDGATETVRRLRLYDPKVSFCERGVEVGDWLALEVPRTATAAALRYEMDVVSPAGETCPTKAADTVLIEAPIVEVGAHSVVIEGTAGRLRPPEPVLDEDAIEAAGLSLSVCDDAREVLIDELTWSDNLLATDAIEVANLPEQVSYTVRPSEAWTVVGSRSGYLHRRVWDGDAGACVDDPALDARRDGRIQQVDLGAPGDAAPYASCPPSLDDIGFASVAALLPEGWSRFTNYSFSVDLFPGCRHLEGGGIELVESQRDTTWTFDLAGPDAPQSISADGVLLGNRVPLLDFRRWQLQLDSASGRVHLLEIRANSVSNVATFE